MRLLLKSVAACTGAAAVIAIAGCRPALINASQAANASGVTAASSSAASPTGGSSQVAGAAAASSPAAGMVATSAAATSQIATALSIGMTLPVHHPAQTTAVIAGLLVRARERRCAAGRPGRVAAPATGYWRLAAVPQWRHRPGRPSGLPGTCRGGRRVPACLRWHAEPRAVGQRNPDRDRLNGTGTAPGRTSLASANWPRDARTSATLLPQ